MKKSPLLISVVDGLQSNYVITVNLDSENKGDIKNRVLAEYQKDATKPGFRKGHVPIHMIEKMLDSTTITMACIEDAINTAINQLVMDDKNNYYFIGQPYDLDMKDYDSEQSMFSFTLDVYPVLHEKDSGRKEVKPEKYSIEISEKEITDVVDQLRSSYASFEDCPIVETGVLTRVKTTYYNQKDDVIGNSKNRYLGREDLEKNEELKTSLQNKKVSDIISLQYSVVAEMQGLSNLIEGEEIQKIDIEIVDIKKKILPELNQEFIDKVFSKEDDVDSVESLMTTITKTLTANKEKNMLYEWTNSYLETIDSSFEIVLPQTLINEELKNKLEHLSKQLGGEKGLQDYLSKMGKKSETYIEEIKKAGIVSMRKFFIIKYVSEQLKLDIDRSNNQEDGSIEQKIYEELTK